jgi:hypothetical protein
MRNTCVTYRQVLLIIVTAIGHRKPTPKFHLPSSLTQTLEPSLHTLLILGEGGRDVLLRAWMSYTCINIVYTCDVQAINVTAVGHLCP